MKTDREYLPLQTQQILYRYFCMCLCIQWVSNLMNTPSVTLYITLHTSAIQNILYTNHVEELVKIGRCGQDKKGHFQAYAPSNKETFLTSQVQTSRRLQYHVVQTPACVIVPLQNDATSMIWIYIRAKEKKNNFALITHYS